MEKNKKFDFKEQLIVGNKGEKIFLELYPEAKKEDTKKYDFSFRGKTVELKTDTYSMEETGNFFMEHIADIKTGKVGGPWRALEDNVDYFVYMFLQEKCCFWFEPKPLVEYLDKYIKTVGYKTIRNKAWTSRGYTLPRELVENLRLKI